MQLTKNAVIHAVFVILCFLASKGVFAKKLFVANTIFGPFVAPEVGQKPECDFPLMVRMKSVIVD